jgi:hypothetical protein
MIRVIAAVIIVAMGAVSAAAHGPAAWVASQGLKNAAGELCCGENDCGVMVAGKIVPTAQGYQVDATFKITTTYGAELLEEVHEIVPYSEAQPSPDGAYWRCRWGGVRKCFFAPPPNS